MWFSIYISFDGIYNSNQHLQENCLEGVIELNNSSFKGEKISSAVCVIEKERKKFL